MCQISHIKLMPSVYNLVNMLSKKTNLIIIISVLTWCISSINYAYGSNVIKTFDEFSTLTDANYDPAANKLYVVDGSALIVIDGKNNGVIKTVDLPSQTSNRIAVNSKTNKIFINLFGTINVIDGNTYDVIKEIDILDNEDISASPSNIAINPKTNILYAKGTNPAIKHGADADPDSNALLPDVIYAVNADTGILINSIEIGNTLGKNTNVSDIKVNSKTNKIYILLDDPENSGIYLTVIDGTTNETIKKLLINEDYFDFGRIVINETTNKIYLTGSPFSGIKVLDGTNDVLLDDIISGNIDTSVGVSDNENKNEIYALGGSDIPKIYSIDGKTNKITGSIAIADDSIYASYLLYNSRANTLYLVDSSSSKISIINLSNINNTGNNTGSKGDTSNNTGNTGDTGAGDSSSSFSNDLTTSLNNSLKELKSAKKELSKIKPARSVAAKVTNLIKTINKKVKGSQDTCIEFSDSIFDLFDAIDEALSTKTCETDTGRKNCIKIDTADTYQTKLDDIFSEISDVFETDDDEDSVPDICKSPS